LFSYKVNHYLFPNIIFKKDKITFEDIKTKESFYILKEDIKKIEEKKYFFSKILTIEFKDENKVLSYLLENIHYPNFLRVINKMILRVIGRKTKFTSKKHEILTIWKYNQENIGAQTLLMLKPYKDKKELVKYFQSYIRE
jgi:hypothetical protein